MKIILIVDENTNHRALIEENLRDDGYFVITATTPAEASELLAFVRPDLVITELGESAADVPHFLQNILSRYSTIPVILHTGYSQHDAAWVARAADAIVLKSADLTELRAAIDRVLFQRSATRAPQQESISS